MKKIIIASLFLSLVSIQARAQQQRFSPDQLETPIDASAETQKLLKDPKKVAASLDTPQAKAAAQNVTALTGGNTQITNQIFDASGDLWKVVVEWQNSDPDFFKKLSENSTDPEFVKKFYDKIPQAQRDKIKNIAAQIENLRSPPAKSP